jgi:hypothetical protein
MRMILRKLGIGLLIFVFFVALVVGGQVSYYPAKALLWHLAHGNHLKIDKVEVRLPLLWLPVPSQRKGFVEIDRAAFAYPTIESMGFSPMSPDEVLPTDQAAIESQHRMEHHLNPSSKPGIFPITIHAPMGNIYCVKDISIPSLESLFCVGAGFSRFILYAGTAAHEREAKSILASMQ